jgi:hypothetical protein
VIHKTARGENKKQAVARTKDMSYSFTQKDSLVEFSKYFQISTNDKWRAQQVEITVLVPKGKKVYIAKNMSNLIYDVDNVHDVLDRDMVGRRWIMTDAGLDCVDCTGLELDMAAKIQKAHRIKIEDERIKHEGTEWNSGGENDTIR